MWSKWGFVYYVDNRQKNHLIGWQYPPFSRMGFIIFGRGKFMDNQRSNPFSTGGGGVTFKQQVGAYYLVSLLASDIPRGLNNGICHSVAFQRRWDGALLDDIVITSRSANGTERHLMLQAKHEITVSAARTNDLFRQVIRDSWTAFQ